MLDVNAITSTVRAALGAGLIFAVSVNVAPSFASAALLLSLSTAKLTVGTSSSAIRTVREAFAPTRYPVPEATVKVTVSVGSLSLSATTVKVSVAIAAVIVSMALVLVEVVVTATPLTPVPALRV